MSNGSLSPDSIRKSSQIPLYNQNLKDPSQNNHLADPRNSQNSSSFRSSISANPNQTRYLPQSNRTQLSYGQPQRPSRQAGRISANVSIASSTNVSGQLTFGPGGRAGRLVKHQSSFT